MSDSITTLLGGFEMEAAKFDGTRETVKVRQLPVRDLPKYLNVYQNEAATVELFCAKDSGWADQLAPESFEALLAAGEKLNLDFLSRYAARQLARNERLLPGFREKVMGDLLGRPAASSPGNPSPATPPPSPSKPD
ncbi:MAG TPA: hypothetical protein VHH73_07095 [Verrucomicrobiae bacterium]|nr:hypothetical protein [Verrucomicrobiae bacterium]